MFKNGLFGDLIELVALALFVWGVLIWAATATGMWNLFN